MPIRPDMRDRYPPDWKSISLEVREAAGWRCQGSPKYPDCRATQGAAHPVTGSIVVLTVAHLDHTPENNGEPGNRPNLRAWCQRCHLAYDMPLHRRNAQQTRIRALNNGDLFRGDPGGDQSLGTQALGSVRARDPAPNLTADKGGYREPADG